MPGALGLNSASQSAVEMSETSINAYAGERRVFVAAPDRGDCAQ